MYRLTTPLPAVKGIGPRLAAQLAANHFTTVRNLVLFVPYRYEDWSVFTTIAELEPDRTVSIRARLDSIRSYYKRGRSIQRGQFSDHTGRLNVIWFNNTYLGRSLRSGQDYIVSGQWGERGVMVQPMVEPATADTIHTGRIVPIYSSSLGIKVGTVRRLLKHILGQLELEDPLKTRPAETAVELKDDELPGLGLSLHQLHFPDEPTMVERARQRLALEELLDLIAVSRRRKQQWRRISSASPLPSTVKSKQRVAAAVDRLPFALTGAQQRVLDEMLADVAAATPMNRILVGDVGSGKTAVAGLLGLHGLAHGQTTCLVAPTRVLARQHAATLAELMPELPLEVITADRVRGDSISKTTDTSDQPRVVIGTHAVINQLERLRPAVVVFDEQHRFGVSHRSRHLNLRPQPHILTMTATPIPRSLMLTIFSHLEISRLDELPPGRQPVKTWLVPQRKRQAAYRWLAEQITESDQPAQAIVVCPFIDPSHTQSLENVAAASDTYHHLQQVFTELGAEQLRIELLHGRQSKKDQQATAKALYDQKIDVLVTTPIVEVGIDLPAATIMVIEAAERYGLASLHQLRGRVGRAGQQGYCLLFTTASASSDRLAASQDNLTASQANKRLKYFTQTTDGAKLADYDLKRRGAGNIFGTEQTGFGSLRFASWANLELIAQARQAAAQLPLGWESPLKLAENNHPHRGSNTKTNTPNPNTKNELLIAPS